MSTTTNLGLFKHDNPATNTNAFDVKSALNDNWDKIDENAGDVSQTLQQQNLRISNINTTLTANLNTEIINRQSITENLQNQIDSLASGSPLVASSVSEMTDTSKTYVNTIDGNWYYYDGTDWVVGGTYQSTEVAENSITICQLDDLLQKNYIKEFENISLNFSNAGYCRVDSNNNFSVEDDTNFHYAIVNLAINTIYDFSGFNYYVLCGLVVLDENDNVVYSTRNQSSRSSSTTGVNLKFKTNQNNLKAYISKAVNAGTSWTDFCINNTNLDKLNNISLNYTDNTLNYIKSYDNKFVTTDTQINNFPKTDSTDGTNYKIYKMNKNCKYKITTANLWLVSGIVITDEKYHTIYSSSNAYHKTIENIVYEFNATENGYIFLSSVVSRYTPIIEIINCVSELTNSVDTLAKLIETNNYYNKKWAVMGDSLTAESTLGSDVKNYVNYVSDKIGINFINYGHGGSGYKARYNNNQAFYQIANTLDTDVDIITVFGSFNDTFSTIDTFPLGTIDDNTTDTIFGSMNVTFDTLINNYPNAVLGIIIPTPWSSRCNFANKEFANNYVNGLIEICKKRNIPYLDLYTKSNLYPWNESFRNSYYLNADGTHPNTLGHRKFANQITEFIKRILY